MKDYLAPEWMETLKHNGLDSFETLWALETEWFEPPNRGRGGWSGVVQLELKCPEGGTKAVFIKRQENHLRRTLQHPIGGEPTFAGEMKNILALQQAGVPTLEPVYYGQRKTDGCWRATLVTQELSGFQPLDQVMQQWQEAGWVPSFDKRRRLISETAAVIRKLHDHRLVHNALYPKHLFVRMPEAGRLEVRLIDLEKMRPVLACSRAARRDLDSLNRRAQFWSRTDRLRFLKRYLGAPLLTAEGKALWHWLAE